MKTTSLTRRTGLALGWAVLLTLGGSGMLVAAEAPVVETETTPASTTLDSAMVGFVTPEVSILADSGYQGWLRKYQGQRENERPFTLGTVRVAGYAGPGEYFIDGNDVFSHNGDLSLDAGLTGKLWLRANNNTQVRRLPVPYPNLVPTADVLSLVSAPPKPGQPGTFLGLLPPFVMAPAREHFNPVVPLEGITPQSEFRIDRVNNSAKLLFKPFKSDAAEFFGDFSSSEQTGEHPLIFRSRRSASPTALTGGVSNPGVSGIKFLTIDPVDSTTTDNGLGLNVGLGAGLLSYRASRQEYKNRVAGPMLPAGFPPNPTSPAERISDSRFDDSSTTSQNAKLALPLGKDFSFSANWIRRDRSSDTAGITLLENINPATGLPWVVPQDIQSKLDTKTASLRYSGVDNLLLTARYRDFHLDRSAPEIIVAGSPDPVNESLSRHEKESEVEASYSGFASTLVRAGYNHSNVDRTHFGVHDPMPDHEWEHPIIVDQSTTNSWRLGFTSYKVENVTLRGNWKNSSTDNPGFHGLPSKTDDLSAGVSYNPSEDMGFFADFRRLDEKNKIIAAPGFVTLADPLVGGDPAIYSLLRETQAGAQNSNKTDTLVLGMFKAVNSKVTIDANITRDKVDSAAFWIIGTESAFPPNIGGAGDPTGEGPELVPYNSKNTTLSTGITYAATQKCSLRGNLSYGRSNGQTSTVGLFRLVPPAGDKTPPEGAWQPFDTRMWSLGLGGSYRTSAHQQLMLEVSFNNWKDKIESAYDGRYTLVTAGWKTEF